MNRRTLTLAAGIVVAVGVPTALSGPASADTSTKRVTVDGTIHVTDLRNGQKCTWEGADVHIETSVVPAVRGKGDRTAWERACGGLTVRFTTGLRQTPSRKTVEADPEMTVADRTSTKEMTYGLVLTPDGFGHDDVHAWAKETFQCTVDLTWVTEKSAPGDRAR